MRLSALRRRIPRRGRPTKGCHHCRRVHSHAGVARRLDPAPQGSEWRTRPRLAKRRNTKREPLADSSTKSARAELFRCRTATTRRLKAYATRCSPCLPSGEWAGCARLPSFILLFGVTNSRDARLRRHIGRGSRRGRSGSLQTDICPIGKGNG